MIRAHISEILAASFAALFVLAMSVFVGAVGTNAQTLSSASATLSATSSAPGPVKIDGPLQFCDFSQNLSLGSRGAEVSALQTYLAGDATLYPEGLVTGYYGPLTVRAVERLQAVRGVVSSGTAATTGYGVFGPKTRATLLSACSGGPIMLPPVTGTTTGSTTGNVVITNADSNQTITVSKGDRVAVQLGDSQNWNVSFDPSDILVRVPNILVTRGEQGVYTAATTGTTTLTATGSAICAANQACPMYAILFKTTIVVK